METINISGSGGKEVPKYFPYKAIRPLQADAIHKMQEAWERGYKYVILEAPAGFGKSAVAITLAKQNPEAFILVSTKMLQDQYIREELFKTIQIKGRSNFKCLVSEKCTCDVGPCLLDKECKHKPRRGSESVQINCIKIADTANDELWAYPDSPLCPYWEQKCDGLNHRYPVMNYSYFLHETAYSAHDFGKRRLMICDEAHNMESELMNFVSFSISDADLELVHCKIPKGSTPIEKWIENLNDWAGNLTLEHENSREAALETRDNQKITRLVEKMKELSVKIDKCSFIAKELSTDPKNWLIDLSEKGEAIRVTFKPVFVKRWGIRFSSMADIFLLQSATIIDAVSLADSLGLPEGECIFMRAGSDFTPEKRPVYFKPIGKMSYNQKHETLPKLANEIKSLIGKYPDNKGVIHTHTYDIQEYLIKNIRSARFIANMREDYRLRDEIIRKFIKSKEPLILVTPSAYEGMDFKDDICRWQVICKIPYPDLGDIQVKKRNELDSRWFQWKTVMRLVQTYGRGIRSNTDWCDTYLFDSSFTDLWRRSKDIFPVWFKEAIVNVR